MMMNNSLISRRKRMPISAELISAPTIFSCLRGECERIIDTGKLLPDFVFRQPFSKYLATEYACLYGDDCATFLSHLSAIYSDESINFITIDPHPVDCYYKRNSWFGLASFDPLTITERYVPTMGAGSDSVFLLAGVNVGAFWGSSLKWTIFADRLRWELALIATQDNHDLPPIGNGQTIAEYIRHQYHMRDPSDSIAKDFASRFFSNYPIK
jgi:hypothetical protein